MKSSLVRVPKTAAVLIGLAGIVLLIVSTVLFYRWDNKFGAFEEMNQSVGFSGTIKVLRKYQGLTYIRTSSGNQFVIQNVRNERYTPPELHRLILSGDSIRKEVGSDTLFVFDQLHGSYYYLLPK